ncbi:MAG: hypothetical protein WC043_05235 [Pseudobdellovibrionaceae bacterium]
MSDDILREVDEAMRVEKAIGFWRDHGQAIMAVIALIVLGTALHAGWKAWTFEQNQAQTGRFLEAFKSEDPAAALRKVADEPKGNVKAIAGLAAAGIAADKEEWDAAIALYTKVAADPSSPALFREQAIVQATAIKMDHQKDANGQALLDELAPVVKLEADKSMWAGRAKLLSALIKANKMDDVEGALAEVRAIVSMKGVSADVLGQAQMLEEVYTVRMKEKKS